MEIFEKHKIVYTSSQFPCFNHLTKIFVSNHLDSLRILWVNWFFFFFSPHGFLSSVIKTALNQKEANDENIPQDYFSCLVSRMSSK